MAIGNSLPILCCHLLHAVLPPVDSLPTKVGIVVLSKNVKNGQSIFQFSASANSPIMITSTNKEGSAGILSMI